ncbi:MAG TPA: HGGxSTG domain-containing protein, partial [Steroidobacteraceae bacterium]|nr:HGGxSTG domain-containing protein [Steroidobacteraceae bacterium]
MTREAPGEPGGWSYALAAANAAPRCGARRKADGLACRAPAMANGRCHRHGGASTSTAIPNCR